VALAVAVPGVLARLMSVASTDGTGGFRLRLWKIAGAAIADRPLVGWGPGAFYEAFGATVLARPDLGVGYTEYGAHNAYFTLAAETGVLGGVAFVALVAAVVFVGVRGALSVGRGIARAPIAVLAAGLLAFSLNSLTSNSFQHPQATVFFWVVAGLMLGAVYGRGRGVDAGAPAPSLAGRAFADSLVGRLTTGDASGGAWRSSRFASALSGVPAAHSQALAASLTLGWAVRGSAVGLAEAPAVLLVANMYPSVRNPKFGSFVAELERAMRAGGRRVTLVANDDSRTGARASAGKYSRFAWRTFMAACRGGYGVVHAHYLFPAGVFAVMAARMRGVPLVVFSHGSDVLLRGWRWPVGALASWVVRSADIVTVPSEHHASAVREAFGAAARRIEVLPIGVDTDVFSPGDRASARTECQLPAEDRIVTFLGALDDNKGVGCQRLIEALSADEFDGVRLVVMGEGPREAELRETTARLGMSGRVTVRPFADRGGVVALLRAADVVAVPSLRESLGLIALEAEAVGTPVAASAVGGLLEHVIPGVNGELFDPSDVGDIRRALRSILNEPERYRAGFDASRYSLSGTAERLAALDRELTEA
jgi:glycosyltransferase involved in cell wall biosynthesis